MPINPAKARPNRLNVAGSGIMVISSILPAPVPEESALSCTRTNAVPLGDVPCMERLVQGAVVAAQGMRSSVTGVPTGFLSESSQIIDAPNVPAQPVSPYSQKSTVYS